MTVKTEEEYSAAKTTMNERQLKGKKQNRCIPESVKTMKTELHELVPVVKLEGVLLISRPGTRPRTSRASVCKIGCRSNVYPTGSLRQCS